MANGLIDGSRHGSNDSSLDGQQFASHFREGLAKFGNLAAASRRDRVCVIPGGQRSNAGDQIVQGAGNRTRNKTQQQESEKYGGNPTNENRSIKLMDKSNGTCQWNENIA